MPIMRHNGNTTAIKNCLSSQMREALTSPISDKGSELSLLMRGSLNSWQSRPWYTGSSPRTRGALTWVPDTRAESRIIPADARNTVSHDPSGRTMSGLSPRMRGTLDLCDRKGDGSRIIPADAGNTVGCYFLL